MTSATVIWHLCQQFAMYGIPEKLASGNSPQFSCQQFKSFAKDWQLVYSTSIPYFPASNDKAKRSVKTAWQLLAKGQNYSQDPWLAIQACQSTATQSMSTSPWERLMGWKARTTFPTKASILTETNNQAAKELWKRQEKRLSWHAYLLSKLQLGDSVRIQPEGNGK